MFTFFKSKKGKQVDMSQISTDMHSHILPGIDDGAQNVEDSLRLIRGLKSFGFKDFMFSPHVLGDYYPNTKATIEKSFGTLDYHLNINKMDCSRSATAEYFYDGHLVELLEKEEIRTLGSTTYFLFELSFRQKPQLLNEFIYNAQMKGYKPILAHPERYSYMTIDMLNELKNRGVSMQLDLMALTNNYGKSVRKLGEKITNNKLYDFVGTDIHHMGHLQVIEEALHLKSAHVLVNENRLKNSSLIF